MSRAEPPCPQFTTMHAARIAALEGRIEAMRLHLERVQRELDASTTRIIVLEQRIAYFEEEFLDSLMRQTIATHLF